MNLDITFRLLNSIRQVSVIGYANLKSPAAGTTPARNDGEFPALVGSKMIEILDAFIDQPYGLKKLGNDQLSIDNQD